MILQASLISKKYIKNKKTIDDCTYNIGAVYQTLEDDWNFIRSNMAQTSAERVGEALRKKFLALDKKYYYYVDAAKYLSIPEK
jgi:hypothetical protein